MDNNSPSPSISIKPKDSTIDSKFGVVVTTPNYLQFFSDVPSYYQFLKDPKNYKDLLLGTVNIGNLIRNSLLINPEFKQLVRDIVLDIDIPSIDTDTIVTIEGEQEVKGRKDFTGGLAVNGQNLIYDPVKKVWQLTGDLVVTGAVTMFGSLSGFTPSTVTDAVLVDGTTIVKTKNSQGQWQLTAIGGGEGGGLTPDEVNILITKALYPVNKNIETKWTQDDTKITNWDSAFNWGDHSKAGYMKSTDFDIQFKKYILKDTVEQISARHNFTDGLQIAGINIYKSQDKTIYLDANLVVSGAITMFGNNSTTFETIWKDIPFDLNTMEWTGSVWRVIGGGSGSLDTNAVNVLISEYLTQNSYATISDISSALVGYATQSWVGDNYLAKSGGTITGALTATSFVGNLTGNADSADVLKKSFANENINYGMGDGLKLIYCYSNPGNFASDWQSGISVLTDYTGWQLTCYGGVNIPNPYFRQRDDAGIWRDWHQLAFLTDNVASATKLQTPRTIWGQSFDGSGNVDGALYMGGATMLHTDDSDTWLNYGGANDGKSLRLCGKEVIFQYGRGEAFTRAMTITDVGNIAVGGTTADEKLHVHGNVKATTFIGNTLFNHSKEGGFFVGDRNICLGAEDGGLLLYTYGAAPISFYTDYAERLRITSSGDVTINGNLLTTGVVTMFSQLSMKNVIDYDGLSLEQLAQIKPARFTWKDGRDNRIHVGGIADYIQPIIPEVIYQTLDDNLTMDYGSAGFFMAASLIKPVIDHEQRLQSAEKEIKDLREENKRLIEQLRAS